MTYLVDANVLSEAAMASQKIQSRKRSRQHLRFPEGGRPTWEVAYLFPSQGNWTEEDFFSLEDTCGGWIRVELSNGRLEVLPMPTQSHQRIIRFLMSVLEAFCLKFAPGEVLFSGIRVRLKIGKKTKIREPDLVYMKAANAQRRHEEFWDGADLVMEVVSGDAKDRARDLLRKPKDYAAAGIPEYWIVDLAENVIRVLTLEGKSYRTHGDFKPGDQATSLLLPGFTVAVADAFKAAKS